MIRCLAASCISSKSSTAREAIEVTGAVVVTAIALNISDADRLLGANTHDPGSRHRYLRWDHDFVTDPRHVSLHVVWTLNMSVAHFTSRFVVVDFRGFAF